MNQAKTHSLLIVDDEPANLEKLRRAFFDGYRIFQAGTGDEALDILRENRVSAIVTDQRMPGITGVDLLREALRIDRDAVRIILTGFTQVEDMMDAINQGHVHRYITKPWEPRSLKQVLEQELERRELRIENERLGRELQRANKSLETENSRLKSEVQMLRESDQPRLIYTSRPMTDLLQMLDRVTGTDSTVLLQGETGTGKELLARYIHEQSDRSGRAFVAVNCGAIPTELVESAFFGHVKGAFTGAAQDSRGHFANAHRGTIFLDEIGEAPLDLQVKLLRVLQEGEVLAVGAQSPNKVDVRVIGSTNRNLSVMVEEGSFRQDLFFRLNVFSVQVPPLRVRPDDIDLLVPHFLERFSVKLNKNVAEPTRETLDILRSYSWPGNVRELENEIERMVILGEDGQPLNPTVLSERIRFHIGETRQRSGLRHQLASLERRLILDSLKRHRQNRSQAALDLGISRQTIISKIKEYRLN